MWKDPEHFSGCRQCVHPLKEDMQEGDVHMNQREK